MISIPDIVFYGFAVLLVGLSIVVVVSKNVFHSAIALTGALGVVAGLFALMGADFLAASQLLIYVGGVMIIMLFVVMLSQQPLEALKSQTNKQWAWGVLFAACVASALVVQFKRAFVAAGPMSEAVPTSAPIGRLLLGDLVIPFEAVSLVLLAALVGAVLFSESTSGESK